MSRRLSGLIRMSQLQYFNGLGEILGPKAANLFCLGFSPKSVITGGQHTPWAIRAEKLQHYA